MIDEGDDPNFGDVIEVSFAGFSGELSDVRADDVLEIETLRVTRVQSIVGITGRSYRVRVIGAREDDDSGGKLLRLLQVPRDRIDMPAVTGEVSRSRKLPPQGIK